MVRERIKSYLRLFIPPILMPDYLRKIYNRIFNRNKLINHFEYEQNFFRDMHL